MIGTLNIYPNFLTSLKLLASGDPINICLCLKCHMVIWIHTFLFCSWCGKLGSHSIGQAREVKLLYLSSQTISEQLGLSAVALCPRVLLWPLAFSLWVGDVNQFGELDSLGSSSKQMCVLLHFCMSRLQEACSSHELSLVELCLGCRWEEASFAFGSTLSLF